DVADADDGVGQLTRQRFTETLDRSLAGAVGGKTRMANAAEDGADIDDAGFAPAQQLRQQLPRQQDRCHSVDLQQPLQLLGTLALEPAEVEQPCQVHHGVYATGGSTGLDDGSAPLSSADIGGKTVMQFTQFTLQGLQALRLHADQHQPGTARCQLTAQLGADTTGGPGDENTFFMQLHRVALLQ